MWACQNGHAAVNIGSVESFRLRRGRWIIRIGIPGETAAGERRVAATAETVRKLCSLGFEIVVEHGAGAASGIADDAYVAAGAGLGTRECVLASEIVVKVRPPSPDEIALIHEGATLIALVQPERNPDILGLLNARRVTAVALERIPRVTRAQKMDVLSSMANLAGYRAVVEAAALYQGVFGPQVTAAGATPPARVLVIGAGVAGLAAIAAARALGAEVRAFDTRAAAREQVQSLGARFLEVDLKESGEGAGGYARVMSKEFYDAEMRLFKQQAAEVDVIITTALVPGTKAPVLVPRDVVEALKPGSIVVDMAAEQGGNCELTQPDKVIVHNGVRVVGYTDLVSRMASSASRLFAGNVFHLLSEMRAGGSFEVDLGNDVIRPAVLTRDGSVLPPPESRPPQPAASPAGTVATRPPPDARPQQSHIMDPNRRAWGTTLLSMLIIIMLFVLGRFAPQDFLQHFTVFILACFVGWQVIWSVKPALHTPLMSVTNAISGIIIIGGILQVGRQLDAASLLGAIAVLFAAINVAGGFLVTQRMLKMFRRDEKHGPSRGPAAGGHP